MAIVTSASVNEFFEEVVQDAIRAQGVQASPAAKTYVIGLLSDFAKPQAPAGQTLDRPLTLLLDEALHTVDLAERFEKLRVLGDGVLYSAGFFADHYEARGVDPGYVHGIGQRAYESAGALIRRGSSTDVTAPQPTDVFGEMASSFHAFVRIIADVADRTVAHGVATSKGLLKLYERWLRTRSESLADALSTHGFVAPRGGRTLQ
jgi:hypothetical protein